MRKLSAFFIVVICLLISSCSFIKNCNYQEVEKGEEPTNQLMNKYVKNYNTFFRCHKDSTVKVSQLPPDNGNFIYPQPPPCPPPPCRNFILMAAVTKDAKAVLLIDEGDETREVITLNAQEININGITNDKYYGFHTNQHILAESGILKLTLVSKKVSKVVYIDFK